LIIIEIKRRTRLSCLFLDLVETKYDLKKNAAVNQTMTSGYVASGRPRIYKHGKYSKRFCAGLKKIFFSKIFSTFLQNKFHFNGLSVQKYKEKYCFM
jgi:hypothetical protein